MQPGKIRQLPDEIRDELDRRLIAGAFGGYTELAAWLAEQGFEVGRSTVHRYGKALKKRIDTIRAASEQTRALIEASPDGGLAMADASIRLVHKRMFDLLLASQRMELGEIAGLARALAATARAGISVRTELRKAMREAADRADQVARQDGVAPDTVARIRAAIEGRL